ncbi:MAG: CHRD domain-containing protein [Solirubrobacteraceae bacterium]
MTARIALIGAIVALAAPATAQAGFSGVVLFGSTALLDGTPSADTVRLFTYGGLVRNDLRARGDLNFAGDADFDSTVAGDQTIPDNAGSVIAVRGADGNDALYADELSATVRLRGQRGNDDFALGDNVLTPVVVDGGSGTDMLDYAVRTTPVDSAPGASSVFAADLSGDQGVPPTASTAVGDVVAVLAPTGELSVDMAVAGMGSLSNGAHVHGPAAPGTTGPVAFDLQPRNTTAFDLMAGPFDPTAGQRDALRNGLMYADAHTTGRPAGEVRGQLAPAGIDRVSTGTARVTQIEDVEGSLTGDTVTGDDGPNALRGGPGDDTLAGGGGADIIDGGTGADTISGDAGDDVILARDGEVDRIACGDGVDSVVADAQDVVAADCEVRGIAPARDRRRPSLTGVRLSASSFRVGRRLTALKAQAALPAARTGQAKAKAAPAGTVLRYRLSEAATVTVDVLPAKGTKFLTRLTRRAKAGARSLAFSGRFKGRTLKPGSYRLLVRATDAAGNRSAARTVRFKVVSR